MTEKRIGYSEILMHLLDCLRFTMVSSARSSTTYFLMLLLMLLMLL